VVALISVIIESQLKNRDSCSAFIATSLAFRVSYVSKFAFLNLLLLFPQARKRVQSSTSIWCVFSLFPAWNVMHGEMDTAGQPEYDADIETGLDTDGEMSVGDALRRRRERKDKKSITARRKNIPITASSILTNAIGDRRGSADDLGLGLVVTTGSSAGDRRNGGGNAGKPWRRRPRRHSTPGFSLNDDNTGDSEKLERLRRRLDAMRRLPRSSRYASSQIEIINKAMEILHKSETTGTGRDATENDQLTKLLAAVAL
tara:strand:+ start:8017 stop:8790 length:774 start_codon:yes stop_codon:yes gene_type:complete